VVFLHVDNLVNSWSQSVSDCDTRVATCTTRIPLLPLSTRIVVVDGVTTTIGTTGTAVGTAAIDGIIVDVGIHRDDATDDDDDEPV
jgi:hypothetical protein